MINESQALTCFAALTDATRLAILRLLVKAGPKGASAGEIGQAVGAASSRAAFHLSTLRQAGLVTSEKVSRQVIYRVDFDQIGSLLSFLVEDCCGGNGELKRCCSGLLG